MRVRVEMSAVVVLLLAVLAVANATPAGFNYKVGAPGGPKTWGGMCKSGFAQSPINIVTAAGGVTSSNSSETPLRRLEFSYTRSKINLVNTGHMLRLNYEEGSTMVADGVEYELKFILFRTPAEHRVRDLIFPLEVQLVHETKDSLDQRKRAILSVLYTHGAENDGLHMFVDDLPKHGGGIAPLNHDINAEDLLPNNRDYWTYDGSDTTPPCLQGVQWVVLTHFQTASPEQIKAFTDIYARNARPPQPLNGRKVRQFIRQQKPSSAQVKKALIKAAEAAAKSKLKKAGKKAGKKGKKGKKGGKKGKKVKKAGKKGGKKGAKKAGKKGSKVKKGTKKTGKKVKKGAKKVGKKIKNGAKKAGKKAGKKVKKAGKKAGSKVKKAAKKAGSKVKKGAKKAGKKGKKAAKKASASVNAKKEEKDE